MTAISPYKKKDERVARGRFSGIAEILIHARELYPQRPALVVDGRTWSYGELGKLVDAAADRMQKTVAVTGSRIAIVGGNHISHIVAWWAAQRLGYPTVEISRNESLKTVTHILNATDAQFVVTDMDDLKSEIQGKRPVELFDEFLSGCEISNSADDMEFLAEGGDSFSNDFSINRREAAIVFTSGTTASAKGVVLTHENFCFVAHAVADYLELTEKDRCALVLPICHTYGKSVMLSAFAAGAAVVMLDSFNRLQPFLTRLSQERCTVLSVVPYHLNVLVRSVGLSEHDFSSLRTITSSSDRLSPSAINSLSESLPRTQIFSMYGLTEATTRVSYVPPEFLHMKKGSCGRPLPGVEIRIVEEDGTSALTGVEGEVLVRGPNVMKGYFGDEDLTDSTIVDGWLMTGDIGHLDEDGFLYIDGRRKDIIKCAGERMNPQEIEEVLMEHPGVEEAAVVGQRDSLMGETIHAYVTIRDSSLKTSDLYTHCSNRLSHLKVPHQYTIVENFPKTATGKIQKNILARDSVSNCNHISSPTEAIAGKIWAELFQFDRINPDDNFFEMGGDSIMLMEMLFRTGDALGMDIRPGTALGAPTFREFCQVIDSEKSEKNSASVERQDNITCAETDTITPRERKEHMPVSFIQEQIVGAELAGLYNPDETRSHCLDLCYRIKGEMDISALDRALCEIVQRHEILRTSYGIADGNLFQHVNDAPQSVLRVRDLRRLAQGDRERETEHILTEIASESFSYLRDRLMMSATLAVGETEHTLVVLVNHVAIDGLSMATLRNELFLLYEAFSHCAPSPLADMSIQYADFAVWEREYFSGERLDAGLAYWRGLARRPLDTTLPVDHTPTVFSYDGDTVPVAIPPDLSTRLRQLGREYRVSLFTVLFSAFTALIHAFSGWRYNFFCIPVGNRSRRETRHLIGCLMNFQFVHLDLSGNPTFPELVGRLDRTLRDVYENYVPFHFVTREIPPQGPVVDFQLLDTPDNGADMNPGGLSLFPFKIRQPEFALFPIDVRLSGSTETISGHFKYQTAVYDRETIQSLVNDYLTFLAKVVREPDIRLNDTGMKPHSSIR